MKEEFWFGQEQLVWLEELNQSYYVDVYRRPWGDGILPTDRDITGDLIALSQLPLFL